MRRATRRRAPSPSQRRMRRSRRTPEPEGPSRPVGELPAPSATGLTMTWMNSSTRAMKHRHPSQPAPGGGCGRWPKSPRPRGRWLRGGRRGGSRPGSVHMVNSQLMRNRSRRRPPRRSVWLPTRPAAASRPRSSRWRGAQLENARSPPAPGNFLLLSLIPFLSFFCSDLPFALSHSLPGPAFLDPYFDSCHTGSRSNSQRPLRRPRPAAQPDFRGLRPGRVSISWRAWPQRGSRSS